MIKYLIAILILSIQCYGASRNLKLGALTASFGHNEAAATVSSLTTGIIDFFTLGETSGNRIGSVSGTVLTNNNVTTVAGKHGNASSFNGTSSYLAGPNNPDLKTGGRADKTITAWIYPTTLGTRSIAEITGGSDEEMNLRIFNGFDLVFSLNSGSSSGKSVVITNGIPAVNQWYFICAWVDTTNSLIGLQVNNNPSTSWTNSTTGIGDFNIDSGTFKLGTFSGGQFFAGLMDSVCFMDRLLTAGEKSILQSDSGPESNWPFGKAPDPDLEIFEPEQYQTFQMNGSFEGTIRIAASLRNTTDSVEARWGESGPWTQLTTSTKGYFTGSISNQTAGTKTLHFRLQGNDETWSVANVSVGHVFLVIGQSNNSGRQGATHNTSSHATLSSGIQGNDYKWHFNTDITDSGWTDGLGRNPVTYDSVNADGASAGGSHWPLLATSLMATHNVPVGFIPAAKGSTSILQWQPGVDRLDRSTLYGAANNRQYVAGGNATGGIVAVLFWQGEQESEDGSISQVEYYDWLVSLADAIWTDMGVELYIVVLQNQTAPAATNQATIRAAQLQAITDHAHIKLLANVEDLSTDDGSHIYDAGKVATVVSRMAAEITTNIPFIP